VKDLTADRNGTTAIEYAVIAGLISIVIVTSVTAIGTKLSSFFASVTFTP
jgi:pilus assembly protein Flp/PilA